jgi:hypothetical protein
LLGRRITQHQHLSAGARGRISKEVAKLGEQDGSKAYPIAQPSSSACVQYGRTAKLFGYYRPAADRSIQVLGPRRVFLLSLIIGFNAHSQGGTK